MNWTATRSHFFGLIYVTGRKSQNYHHDANSSKANSKSPSGWSMRKRFYLSRGQIRWSRPPSPSPLLSKQRCRFPPTCHMVHVSVSIQMRLNLNVEIWSRVHLIIKTTQKRVFLLKIPCFFLTGRQISHCAETYVAEPQGTQARSFKNAWPVMYICLFNLQMWWGDQNNPIVQQQKNRRLCGEPPTDDTELTKTSTVR